MNQTEVKTRLREMAGEVIATATQMIRAVSHGAEPIGIADPEPWAVKRMYARRILRALESGGRVDRRWLIGIAKARAEQFGQGTQGGEPGDTMQKPPAANWRLLCSSRAARVGS